MLRLATVLALAPALIAAGPMPSAGVSQMLAAYSAAWAKSDARALAAFTEAALACDQVPQ